MQQKIIKMLEKFAIPNYGVLMIHSAFKGFSRDGYDPDSVIRALKSYMHKGTLVFPSMSWRSVNLQSPTFDELATPCNTGMLCEIFRTQHATHRSIHPTHSVCALGNQAEFITASHYLSQTPCDVHSPFRKMVDLNGYVIMLGVGIDCCTIIHAAEEHSAPNIYLKSEHDPLEYNCIARDGNVRTMCLRRHQFLPRNYWLIQDKLAEQNRLMVNACDSSVVLGFCAQDVYNAACAELLRDPSALLAKPGQRYRMM